MQAFFQRIRHRLRRPTVEDPLQMEHEVSTWRTSRRWVLAGVIAAFPMIFLIDDAGSFSLSPVLPGLAVLALALVLLPFVLQEVAHRRAVRRGSEGRAARALRAQTTSRLALGVALAWFAAWLIWGA